jgi:uncharacterized coiled-coil protein SlyX
MSDARLTELEIRYTHQVELLRALDETVVAQHRRIELLEARLVLLEKRLHAAVDELEPALPHEKPPHY